MRIATFNVENLVRRFAPERDRRTGAWIPDSAVGLFRDHHERLARARAVELAKRVPDRRLILLVRWRKQEEVVGHLLDETLGDAESDVTVRDLLVGRMQAREAENGEDGEPRDGEKRHLEGENRDRRHSSNEERPGRNRIPLSNYRGPA